LAQYTAEKKQRLEANKGNVDYEFQNDKLVFVFGRILDELLANVVLQDKKNGA
jgi:hypothetical protein